MSRRFEGRSIIVTGAASGIGLAGARAFAAEGGRVLLADRNAAGVEAAAEAIRRDGGAAVACTADVANYASCQEMVARAVEAHGGLHVAFNNAGIPSALYYQFDDCPIDAWRQVIDVNLSGVFYCMKAEVPALKASGGTAIVNTASVASLVAAHGMAAYVSSKHGVAGLTKAAALDLIKHGIRVNAVCPGIIRTPMVASAMHDPKFVAAMEAAAPAGRIGEAEEPARAALFLASDEASYIVGALLTVDGGLVIQ